MNFRANINSVQAFVRSVVWVISVILLGLLVVLPLGALSNGLFQTPWVLATPALIFVMWLAGIISGIFFIAPEWERIVILRLGKFESVRGPGFFIIPPFIFSVAAVVDTRIETHQVEATATLTKDNVPTKVTAAVEFKVEDPKKATLDVQNYRLSVTWLSTEALKNTIGSMDLKDLLSERDQIADKLREQIDEGATIYGIDVRAVRITDIDTPQSLVEELAVIARARRASEAKQIQADAEVLVARKIAQASNVLDQAKDGLRLRELQTLTEISKETGNMVIVYPYGDRTGQEIANGRAGNVPWTFEGSRRSVPEGVEVRKQ